MKQRIHLARIVISDTGVIYTLGGTSHLNDISEGSFIARSIQESTQSRTRVYGLVEMCIIAGKDTSIGMVPGTTVFNYRNTAQRKAWPLVCAGAFIGIAGTMLGFIIARFIETAVWF